MKVENAKYRKPTEAECGKAKAKNHAFNEGVNQTRRKWLAITDKLNDEIVNLKRLNAAAPELLAALEKCERHLLSSGYGSTDLITEARAAIAKANNPAREIKQGEIIV